MPQVCQIIFASTFTTWERLCLRNQEKSIKNRGRIAGFWCPKQWSSLHYLFGAWHLYSFIVSIFLIRVLNKTKLISKFSYYNHTAPKSQAICPERFVPSTGPCLLIKKCTVRFRDSGFLRTYFETIYLQYKESMKYENNLFEGGYRYFFGSWRIN